MQPDVDDTDGLDPGAEFDLWRARELARLLRDKQAQAERDEEKAEIERRRALPEEQRLREDLEYAEKTRQREKGEMGFLQKYYHKGAFHQVRRPVVRDRCADDESGRRSAQPGLYCCYGECCGYEYATEGHAGPELRKGATTQGFQYIC